MRPHLHSRPIQAATARPAVDDRAARRVRILGAPVSIIDMGAATSRVEQWVDEKCSRYICLADVHSVMRARWDTAHGRALAEADLVLPDGMPLVWSARARGVKSIRRVAGADFMHELCRRSPANWSHYFLGGAPGVPERLADVLCAQYRHLRVCGTFSPPFRALSEAEDDDMVARINAAKPDILWIGLGCPKQELWMAQPSTSTPASPPARRGGCAIADSNGCTVSSPTLAACGGAIW